MRRLACILLLGMLACDQATLTGTQDIQASVQKHLGALLDPAAVMLVPASRYGSFDALRAQVVPLASGGSLVARYPVGGTQPGGGKWAAGASPLAYVDPSGHVTPIAAGEDLLGAIDGSAAPYGIAMGSGALLVYCGGSQVTAWRVDPATATATSVPTPT